MTHTESLGRQHARLERVRKHVLIVMAVAAAMVALWMIGVLHEAPPLISN